MSKSSVLIEKIVIPRHQGWEEVLEPLVRKITGAQQGKCRTGVDYENDTFKMKMHFMGTCGCPYGIARREYENENSHNSECFHTHWQEIRDAFTNHPKYSSALILKTERINMEMQLCRKYRIPYHGGEKIEYVCTCDFEKKWENMGIDHDEDCPSVTPNFWFKDTDFKVWWYKKFFKESYSNQRIDKIEFKEMVKMCTRSCNGSR